MKNREFGLKGMNSLTVENSQKSLSILDGTIEKVSKQRANLLEQYKIDWNTPWI